MANDTHNWSNRETFFLKKYQIMLCSSFLCSEGKILSYGKENTVICHGYTYDNEIDCQGGSVLPGEFNAFFEFL